MADGAALAVSAWRRAVVFLEMIKVAHTLFALPFAIGAAFLAARGLPPAPVLGKIVLAVLCARTAAMAFNRLADRRFDAANPRTAARALPAGTLSVRFVAASVVLALVGFFLTAWWLNPLAFALAPAAAVVILGYSLAKRVTAYCHFFLGAALALAPLGAWVAVRGELALEPILLAAAVLLWSAGFDIIYSCLDADFDRAARLHSIPERFGIPAALRVAALLHFAMVGMLAAFAHMARLSGLFFVAVGLAAALLAYEHWIVRPGDLARVNRAFFATNAVISTLVMAALIAEATRS
ncbi:MAG: putative 4-hydroxybenzoate polyprenyltransferase [Planctomycetes bacterium]|nr:putative 4-hydroxybenzoate polyprenyltransferase [Planctomycetota bacterium]